MDNIYDKIEGLRQSHFWGSLEIMFQNGVPVILRQVQTIKLKSEVEEGGKAWEQREKLSHARLS